MLHEERPLWLYVGMGWILAGGAADLGLTLWGLRLGVIQEANPVIAPLLATRPVLASCLKLGATAAGVWALYWAYPQRRSLVAAGMALVSAGLLVVLKLHLDWLWLVTPWRR